jgi:hypothetical protein
MVAFARALPAAVRTDLLLCHRGGNLLSHQCVLQLREHRFGLVKRESEGVGCERLTLQAANLRHDGWFVIAFNQHLYRHAHASTSALASPAAYC